MQAKAISISGLSNFPEMTWKNTPCPNNEYVTLLHMLVSYVMS